MDSPAQKPSTLQKCRDTILCEVEEVLPPPCPTSLLSPLYFPEETSRSQCALLQWAQCSRWDMQPLAAPQDNRSQGGQPELTLPCCW